jgi:hypothetical protein
MAHSWGRIGGLTIDHLKPGGQCYPDSQRVREQSLRDSCTSYREEGRKRGRVGASTQRVGRRTRPAGSPCLEDRKKQRMGKMAQWVDVRVCRLGVKKGLARVSHRPLS